MQSESSLERICSLSTAYTTPPVLVQSPSRQIAAGHFMREVMLVKCVQISFPTQFTARCQIYSVRQLYDIWRSIPATHISEETLTIRR